MADVGHGSTPASGSLHSALPQNRGGEPWVLVERFVARYPNDWRLVFKSGATTLEVAVPEEVWRAFDGIQL